MKPGSQQTIQSVIFQWIIIALGGVVWLENLARLLFNFERKALLEITLFGLAVIVVSLKPVHITTPGMKLGHKRQLSVSLSDALTFLLMMIYGPQAAIVWGGIDGLIASIRTVKRWQSNLFTLAMIALSILATSQTYGLMMRLGGYLPYDGLNHQTRTLVLPLLVATTVHFVVNSLLLAALIALRYRRSIWRQLVDNHLWIAITYYPLAAFSIILYACMQRFGWFSVVASLPVLVVIYLSYRQYNQKVEEKLHKIEEINGLNLATVRALTLAIDARSGTSAGHADRVKIYVRGLARHLNLSELETQALEAGAMLRDVGMLAVPDHVLNKPGQLTPAELEKMKMHTVIGSEILSQVNFPYPVVPIVRHHHERWNGEGYPDGLRGEDIPLMARILSVADCFDAVRETRSYRQALNLEQSIHWLRESSASLFDPQVVETFIAHLPEFEAEIAAWTQNRQPASSSDQPSSTENKVGEKQRNFVPAGGYAQSLEQISGVHREVVMLYELAQTVGRSLSLSDTLNVLLARLCEFVPSTTSAVLLKEKESDVLRVVQVLGNYAENFQEQVIAQGNGTIGKVFLSQSPLCNINPQPDLQALQLFPMVTYRTSLVVPLTKGEESLGVLVLYHADLNEYSSEHIRLVEAVARLAGDAIANALHYEATEARAYTDRLTGLPNSRAILQAFDIEAERARRTAQPFSFLMMDLDGFKAINDTLGHHIGDVFLIEISERIKSQLRITDFLGRYAGDEFIAILPNTSLQEITEVIERIKDAVDHHQVTTEDGKIARGGISIGAIECDGNKTTLKDLMEQADVAMYADKSERKQRKATLDKNQQVLQFSMRKPA